MRALYGVKQPAIQRQTTSGCNALIKSANLVCWSRSASVKSQWHGRGWLFGYDGGVLALAGLMARPSTDDNPALQVAQQAGNMCGARYSLCIAYAAVAAGSGCAFFWRLTERLKPTLCAVLKNADHANSAAFTWASRALRAS